MTAARTARSRARVRAPPEPGAQGGLVQDRLGRGRQPPALGEQPGLERVGVPDADAVEQVGAQPGQLDGVAPVPWTSTSTSRSPRRQGEATGSPSRTAVGPRARRISARLQRSAPQRVVRLGEQQRGQLAARRRALAEQQEGQERPALAAAVAVARRSVDLDEGSPEQVYAEPRWRVPLRVRLVRTHETQRGTQRVTRPGSNSLRRAFRPGVRAGGRVRAARAPR